MSSGRYTQINRGSINDEVAYEVRTRPRCRTLHPILSRSRTWRLTARARTPQEVSQGQNLMGKAEAFCSTLPARFIDLFTIQKWTKNYDVKRQLAADVIAGLTVGVMAVPQAMSYALVAGMPGAIYGLYNALMGLLPYPFFGTSPHLISGPTAVMSILVKSSIPSSLGGFGEIEEGTDKWLTVALTLSFMAGILQILMGVFKLGFLIELVSEPVIVGFTTGSAFLIAATQFSNMLGIPKCKKKPCHFHESVGNVLDHTGDFSGPTILFAFIALTFLLVLKYPVKKWLRGTRWSLLASFGPFVLVCVSIMVVRFGDPNNDWKIKQVGKICDKALGPSCLPTPQSALKSWFFHDLIQLIPAAVGVALIGYMESMTVAKTCARQQALKDKPEEGVSRARIEPSQELIALGICNTICSFFQGYPVTGSFSRTAVNAATGATSPLASLIAGTVVGSALLLLTSVLRYTPKVALATIVLSAVVNLIEPSEFMLLWRVSKSDFIACILVFLTTLFFGVEAALALGIIANWAICLAHNNRASAAILGKRLDVRPEPTADSKDGDNWQLVDALGQNQGGTYDHLVMMRLFTDLNFSSAPAFCRQLGEVNRTLNPVAIAVDCTNVNNVDATGIRAVMLTAGDLIGDGVELSLGGFPDESLQVLLKAWGHLEELQEGRVRWEFVGIDTSRYAPDQDSDEGPVDSPPAAIRIFPTMKQAVAFSKKRLGEREGKLPGGDLGAAPELRRGPSIIEVKNGELKQQCLGDGDGEGENEVRTMAGAGVGLRFVGSDRILGADKKDGPGSE